jgi:hypothetical protein
LQRMRSQYEAWATQVPPLPEDARVSLVYSLADMPAR